MKHLKRMALAFLGVEIKKFVDYKGNQLTIQMKDRNLTIDGRHWQEAMKEFLEEKDFKNIRYEYGDSDWVTIFAD